MPANLDSMMYVKRTEADIPWHREGTAVPQLATAAECVKAAGLDWDVIKLPAAFRDGDSFVEVPDKWMTVRTDTRKPLGYVGNQYTPLQNKECFGFFDGLVGEGKAIYETAGSLDGGKKVWLLAKLPGEIRVLGDDVVTKYCLLANGHDGMTDIAIGLTPVRVVCQNTLTMALATRSNWMSAPHRKGVALAVSNMGKLLATLNKSFDDAGDKCRAMVSAKFTEQQARNFFVASYTTEVRDCVRAGRKWAGEELLASLFETGTGQDLKGVRGTLWAAYNAVTEYEDYIRPTREGTSRMNRNNFGQGAMNKLAAARNAQLVIDGKATFGTAPEVEPMAAN